MMQTLVATKNDVEEISLTDIGRFLHRNWISIISGALVGALASILLLIATTPQFEAVSQVQMAQVKNNNNNNVNPAGTNVEDPNLLIARLRLPSTYTTQTIQACGLQNNVRANEVLADLVKAIPTKNAPSVVEIRVQRESPELASRCGDSLFNMIRQQQEALLQPFLAEAKRKLLHLNTKLEADRALVAKMNSTNMQSAVYLATRDEIKNLTDDIESLNTEIDFQSNRMTKLIAPIYVSNTPISPKKYNYLITGLLIGLVLGVTHAVISSMRTASHRKTGSA